MSSALRSAWQSVVHTKRLYLNPHEDFGRANIFRCALATYVTGFLLFKWNSSRKNEALKAEKLAQKNNVAHDAVARAGAH